VDSIVRDLDGRPLTREYFATTMGVPIDDVESYACPEEDAFRGFMSNACRVRLVPTGKTAFYKRIDFETLDHAREKLRKAPQKLIRDVRSYEVVANFLSSTACAQLTKMTGVRIPKCYEARLEPDRDRPIRSKFSFLYEDLDPSDGWYQEWLLRDVESCESALTAFAKIHAYFWTGSDFWTNENDDDDDDDATTMREEFETGVWDSGSYVQPMAQGTDQWKKVATEWTTKRTKFQHTKLSTLECWDTLGERLESVAEECGCLAHPFAEYDDDDGSSLSDDYQQYRTFTHGDPKQANLLFRRRTSTSAAASTATAAATTTTTESQLEVGLIDFQWSGFGLAATDIAHFVTSAVHADRLVDGGDETLLQYYYDELQTYLVAYGAYPTAREASAHYSYDTFLEQYEIGVLDICRLVIAYTWDRFTEPVDDDGNDDKDDVTGVRARTMNKTSYNKSIPNVIWLITKCDEILRSRGV